MKICIGIISYLPDNKIKRANREYQLNKLIKDCNRIFNLPIMIIAQNWKDFSIDDNITLFKYDQPLGIVGARKELRQKFLNSDYDYLIMLDDDCEIQGTRSSGINYINEIKNHPGMFGIFNGTLLKLFAISKEIFLQLDYGNGNVESGDFFEDILFVNTLLKKYPNKKFQFKKQDIFEKSNNYNDPNSTWFHGQFNKHDIGDKTRKILSTI